MKNKKLTYGLLVIVTALWGVIFYRIIISVSGDHSDGLGKPATAPHRIPKADLVPEEYTLLLNYRDPFLETAERVRPKPVSANRVEEVASAAPMDWSFVQYLGVVTNPSTGKKVTLLNISGRDYMMQEGDAVDGVSLIRNYQDSVKISYDGKQAFIKH